MIVDWMKYTWDAERHPREIRREIRRETTIARRQQKEITSLLEGMVEV